MNIFRLPLRAIIVLLALFYVVSCQEKQDEPVSPTPQADTTTTTMAEQAYPGVDCIWQDGTLNGTPIRYGIINGQAIFQGDIILTPEQLAPEKSTGGRTSGAGTSDKVLRWRNFTIPYTIASNLPNKSRVTEAIAHWEARTPIRFVPRTNETDYVTFRNDASESGCFSDVGRTGGQQYINVDVDCSKGNVIHEIGHLVGLLHEQTRSDRNDYIIVNRDNIEKNKRDQFIPYTEDDEVVGFDYGKFDFGSVMLYSSNAFSSNSAPGMVRKEDGKLFTGQRNGLSGRDVSTVTAMYANFYMVAAGSLHGLCLGNGQPVYIGADKVWNNVSRTMAEDGKYVWLINDGTLYRVNRLSGKRRPFGDGWNGTVGLAGTDPNGNMYAVQNDRLWRVDRNGNRTRLSNPQDTWAGTEAIYYHNGFLYIVWSGHLWKVNPQTGLSVKDLGNGWNGTTAIAAITQNANELYVIQHSSLYRINTSNGNWTKVGSSQWTGTDGMVSTAGKLYIVQGAVVWAVDENGNRQDISSAWEVSWVGVRSVGMVRNSGVL